MDREDNVIKTLETAVENMFESGLGRFIRKERVIVFNPNTKQLDSVVSFCKNGNAWQLNLAEEKHE